MVYAEIVGNAHGPGKKFTFFRVTASPNGVDDLNEHVLEDVFCQILVFDEKKNGSVELVLVADYQGFKCL
jgi:hypothetical protein